MGLDLVDFILALEDTFDLSIPDEDAQKLISVGDTVDYIEANLGIEPQSHIVKLRNQDDERFLEEVGHKLSKFDPETRLQSILDPNKNLASQWTKLKLQPPVKRPRWVTMTIKLMILIVATIGLSSRNVDLLVLILIVLLLSVVLFVFTHHLKKLPSNDLKIRDLGWWWNEPLNSREVIFNQVADIIVDQLGVTRDQVTEEAEFARDLGCG